MRRIWISVDVAIGKDSVRKALNLLCIPYRNQTFDLHTKSNVWLLYEMQHWAEMGKNALKPSTPVWCSSLDIFL